MVRKYTLIKSHSNTTFHAHKIYRMPKKRAVRRQTQSHQHDHVKNAAKRARNMWANRSKKKKIFFRPPGLPLVKRGTKKNKAVGKSRSDTEPLVEKSHITRHRRTQTEGSKLRENLPRSPPQKNSTKPGRLSYISVPSSESSRIKRMSDVQFS